MGDTIYYRDRHRFMATELPTQVTWFGKSMIISNMITEVIKNQDFGVTSESVKALLEGWEVGSGVEEI